MHIFSNRRRRKTSPAGPAAPADGGSAGGGWISLVGKGSGFHDCPLCRELASHPDSADGIEAVVGINPESLPELMRAGWLDELVDLVGPNATVRVMGHDMESQPVEEISMAAFLARLGYE